MKTVIAAARAAATAAAAAKIDVTYVIGRCLPSVKTNAAKISVQSLVFDNRLKMAFDENTTVYAYDPDKTVKTGDIVLIKKLPEKKTTLITHSIEKIVYRLGDVIDPITNKPVAGAEFRDDIAERNKLYGEVDTAFNYAKAPPRGRLEGTRDITDKPTYTKYYEGCNDPYAW